MFCTNCGAQPMEGVGFCSACGTKMGSGTTGAGQAPTSEPESTLALARFPVFTFFEWGMNKGAAADGHALRAKLLRITRTTWEVLILLVVVALPIACICYRLSEDFASILGFSVAILVAGYASAHAMNAGAKWLASAFEVPLGKTFQRSFSAAGLTCLALAPILLIGAAYGTIHSLEYESGFELIRTLLSSSALCLALATVALTPVALGIVKARPVQGEAAEPDIFPGYLHTQVRLLFVATLPFATCFLFNLGLSAIRSRYALVPVASELAVVACAPLLAYIFLRGATYCIEWVQAILTAARIREQAATKADIPAN